MPISAIVSVTRCALFFKDFCRSRDRSEFDKNFFFVMVGKKGMKLLFLRFSDRREPLAIVRGLYCDGDKLALARGRSLDPCPSRNRVWHEQLLVGNTAAIYFSSKCEAIPRVQVSSSRRLLLPGYNTPALYLPRQMVAARDS